MKTLEISTQVAPIETPIENVKDINYSSDQLSSISNDEKVLRNKVQSAFNNGDKSFLANIVLVGKAIESWRLHIETFILKREEFGNFSSMKKYMVDQKISFKTATGSKGYAQCSKYLNIAKAFDADEKELCKAFNNGATSLNNLATEASAINGSSKTSKNDEKKTNVKKSAADRFKNYIAKLSKEETAIFLEVVKEQFSLTSDVIESTDDF